MPKKISKSNDRRDPNKKSQTFWLHKDLIRKLNELSDASMFSKTDLVKYWIEREYELQAERGKLDTPREPFQ